MIWPFKQSKPTERAPVNQPKAAPVPTLNKQVEAEKPVADPAHLPDRLKMELFQIASVQPLERNDELIAKTANASGVWLLMLDSQFELKALGMPGRGPQIKESYLLLTPEVLEDLMEQQLICRSAGKLLTLKSEDVEGASSNLRSHVDRWQARSEHLLLQALAKNVASLTLSHRQLSNNHRKQLAKGKTQFAESKLVAAILARIPRLPVGTNQILAALTDENSTPVEIADLIKRDAGLSALLLKAINSPQYALDKPVSDIDRCIVLLGFEGAYELVMSAGLKRSLPDTPKFHRSYDRSIELAQVAFSVAQTSAKANPSEMSTIALLSDVGLVVSDLIKRQHPEFKDLIAMVEPSKFGGALLKSWSLPELISKTISMRDYPAYAHPEELEEGVRFSLAVLHLAEYLHSTYLDPESGGVSLFLDEYLNELGWGSLTLDEVWLKTVVPNLKKRRNVLPVTMRDL